MAIKWITVQLWSIRLLEVILVTIFVGAGFLWYKEQYFFALFVGAWLLIIILGMCQKNYPRYRRELKQRARWGP